MLFEEGDDPDDTMDVMAAEQNLNSLLKKIDQHLSVEQALIAEWEQ